MDPHDYDIIIYLIPILASWLVTLGLGVMAYRRRRVTGALQFALIMGLEAQWIGGYIFELLAPTLEGKIFWDNFQYIGTLFVPLMILVFAMEYCGNQARLKWKLWVALSLPAVMAIFLCVTNPWHNLALLNQRLIPGVPFDIYEYDYGVPVYAVMIYSYILMFWAIYLLVKHFLHQPGMSRRQTGFVLAGIIIPVVSSFTSFFNLPFLPQRDISPYYFAVADLFIAYGLFNYRLFDIVPFARDLVMENMQDGVIIVDGLGRLLDINTAAKDMLKISANASIGQPLVGLLPPWMESIELDPVSPFIRKEIVLRPAGELKTVDLHITRLVNKAGNFSGHMMILRDISAHKLQEDALRHDQDVLEQRVSERTADLAAANEHLTAEVEQRRHAEQEKELQRSEMEILYSLTVELSAMPLGADLEDMVTSRLKELTGAYLVSVSQYNPAKKQLELRRVETDSSAVREASRLLGRSVAELAFPVSEAMYAEMVTEVVGYRDSLSEATFGAIPPAVGSIMQKLFDLELFIGMAAQSQGNLMGSFMLIFQKGQKPPSDRLVRALTNILSIIYQRNRAEMARFESENRFHALAEMLPQSIFECDLSGRLTYANRKTFEMIGIARLEPDLTIYNFVVAAQHEQLREKMHRILENPVETHREYRVQRQDGGTFPALVYSAPIIQNGRLVGVRGVVMDITEIKSVEDALRSSEEKFRSIIEQSSEGFILIGEDGLVLELNQAFEQIYGMSKSEILGKPFWEMTRRLDYPKQKVFDPVKGAQKEYQEIIQTGPDSQAISNEVEFIAPNGQQRVIQRTSFPVVVSAGRRMAAVVSDITARKSAELEQRRLNRTLTMISECNKALIRMEDEASLLEAICHIIVEIGEYRFAWIGSLADGVDQKIRPVIAYGQGGDYLDILATNDKNPETQCLLQFIKDGIQASQAILISDTRTDPFFAPHRDESVQHGFLSVFIFPLVFGTELFGSLNIYGRTPYAPDQNELNLLTEMVNDVSFGIHALRMHIDRDRAEQKVYEANTELNRAYEATLEGWSRALELRERETAGHSQRVVALTLAVASKMGVPEEELIHVRRGALLHDIGKMGIPDHILLKPATLTDDEWVIMRQHPLMAHRLLSRIPYLAPALDIPYSHHERWDGSGYPHGLKGEAIPLVARIFAVVDVWDALINDRPYRPAWTEEDTRAYLKSQAGKQLDPRVVSEFLSLPYENPE